jgi:type VI protein secretion system component Hcp
MSDSKKAESTQKVAAKDSGELPEAALDQVAGGKVSVHDINITKKVDKASPVLLMP